MKNKLSKISILASTIIILLLTFGMVSKAGAYYNAFGYGFGPYYSPFGFYGYNPIAYTPAPFYGSYAPTTVPYRGADALLTTLALLGVLPTTTTTTTIGTTTALLLGGTSTTSLLLASTLLAPTVTYPTTTYTTTPTIGITTALLLGGTSTTTLLALGII